MDTPIEFFVYGVIDQSFKFASNELSQKCDILLLVFFIYLFLFDCVKVYIIRLIP